MKRAYQLLIYFRDNFGEYITEFKRVLSSSLCKCMAPSKTSISMSLFLMSRWTFLMFLEPLKLNRADCKSANKTWAVTQEIAVEYCSSFSEAMSSEISLHIYWFWSDEDFIDSQPWVPSHPCIDIFCTKEPNWTNVEWEVDRLKKKGGLDHFRSSLSTLHKLFSL